MSHPRGEQRLTERLHNHTTVTTHVLPINTHLIKVSGICHEGRGEQYVTTDGGHLTLERLTASVPTFPLVSQTGQEGLTTVNLGDIRGVSLIFTTKLIQDLKNYYYCN